MPPLFVLGSDGKAALVNHRVQGRDIIVDRLFGAAELRLGTKKRAQRVRITRYDAKRGASACPPPYTSTRPPHRTKLTKPRRRRPALPGNTTRWQKAGQDEGTR